MQSPLTCPICWDHRLKQIEGVQLTVTTADAFRNLGRAAAYHCSNWHVFAILHREEAEINMAVTRPEPNNKGY